VSLVTARSGQTIYLPPKAQYLLRLETDDCVIWPFGRFKNGYAAVWCASKMRYVHREVCRAVHGEPPTEAHQAAHSCGQGHAGCVNKRHLRWATPLENTKDKYKHGTADRPDCRGELGWCAKLTEADVIAIRTSRLSSRKIAPLYGVSHAHIRGLRRREKWTHL